MGAWGDKAWQNDAAADWYASMFEESELADHVLATLELRRIAANAEQIRAACYVLVVLGKLYVWPVDSLKQSLQLALKKLKAIAKLEEYKTNVDLKEEIAILQERIEELK